MKRINNKGVILLETLLVSVFILSIFIFVYRNSIPMMGLYKKLETFDDIDSVYAANTIKNLIVTELSDDKIENSFNGKTYVDVSSCDTINSDEKWQGYCNTLKNLLDITENDMIYITRYDVSNFRNDIMENNAINANFREYVKTVTDQESFYDPANTTRKINGRFRIFISRTVPKTDGTTITKYANIGIYQTINRE
ncbi:MAG: hypothetical protein PUB18_06325 [bacterium]|nr:hypothetical protein [bacterium]